MKATQGALFRLERWSEHWCLPLNPSKCEASFFSVDPHHANLQPNLLLLGSRLRFNLIPTFVGVTFDGTLSFSKQVSLLKAKFFPRLRALRCISASSWGLPLCSVQIFSSVPSHLRFTRMVSFPKHYHFHQIGTPPPSGQSRLSEASLPPLRVTLTHFTVLFYEWALRLPTSYPISGLARLGVKPSLCRSCWRAFASTHPLILPSICFREALVACPPCPPWSVPSFTVECTLSTPCSRSDSPHSRQGAAHAHLDSLPLMI